MKFELNSFSFGHHLFKGQGLERPIQNDSSLYDNQCEQWKTLPYQDQ